MVARAIISAVLCAFAIQAHAAGTISSRVLQVRVDQDGRGMVIFEQPVGGSPASCVGSGYRNMLAFNANTAAGKAIMSLALSAKFSGALVTAYGTGTCDIYGGQAVEDWLSGAA